MKKMIAAFDGLKFSGSTKAYAIRLAQQSNAYPVGPFLDDTSYTSYNPFFVVFENSAYRRRMVSRWFHSSIEDTLMKELNVPLFIAHN